MSLQKILLDISTELGISVATDAERSWIIEKINDAARELYESQDITGCLREQTFNADSDGPQFSSLVALPYYVDQIRGMRFSKLMGGKISANDMRPRYHFGRGWGTDSFVMPYRIVRERAPLKRDISNASVLKFTIPEAEAVDVVINIVGETTNSARSAEQVTLIAGDLSVTSSGNFVDVTHIEKSAVNVNDIIITDVEDNELGVIPNSEVIPIYKWLELQDSNAGFAGSTQFNQLTAMDFLYKVRFTPFVNLYDEFPCPKCDRIIFYKFAEYYEGQQTGHETRVAMAAAKSAQLLDNLNTDSEAGKDMEIEFGSNGFTEAQQPFRNWWSNLFSSSNY